MKLSFLVALIGFFLWLLNVKRKGDDLRLSKNFVLSEFTKTSTGFSNAPNDQEVANLKKLVDVVLQPLRNDWGAPLIVTSGFRSDAVNEAVGGVDDSKHRLALAADVKPGNGDFEGLFRLIRESDLPVKAILETGKSGERWIHIELLEGESSPILLTGVYNNDKGVFEYDFA